MVLTAEVAAPLLGGCSNSRLSCALQFVLLHTYTARSALPMVLRSSASTRPQRPTGIPICASVTVPSTHGIKLAVSGVQTKAVAMQAPISGGGAGGGDGGGCRG